MTPEAAAGHVRQVFARELAEVHDEGLREKVVRTWARSMALSGAEDLAQDLHMNPDMKKPGVGLLHMRGAVQISLAIADALIAYQGAKIDRDLVAAGALLHDVGKLLEYGPPDRHILSGHAVGHAFSGVELAVQEGVPREVLHIIAYHSQEGQRIVRSQEGEIVHTADCASADDISRRELGIARSKRSPIVYIPR